MIFDTANWGVFAFLLLVAGVVFWLERSDRFHLAYSKYRRGGTLNTRVAMTVIYAPALILSVLGYFAVLAPDTLYHRLLFLAFAFHFAKRVLESLFLHRYSKPMGWGTTIMISLLYSLIALSFNDAHNMTTTVLQAESLALAPLFVGLVIFLLGQGINFYHHWILRNLRGQKDQAYKVPAGGLFGLVACPHYLGEIIAWFGLALMSRQLIVWGIFWVIFGYLAGRAIGTRRWYRAHVPDYPEQGRALIPYLL